MGIPQWQPRAANKLPPPRVSRYTTMLQETGKWNSAVSNLKLHLRNFRPCSVVQAFSTCLHQTLTWFRRRPAFCWTFEAMTAETSWGSALLDDVFGFQKRDKSCATICYASGWSDKFCKESFLAAWRNSFPFGRKTAPDVVAIGERTCEANQQIDGNTLAARRLGPAATGFSEPKTKTNACSHHCPHWFGLLAESTKRPRMRSWIWVRHVRLSKLKTKSIKKSYTGLRSME